MKKEFKNLSEEEVFYPEGFFYPKDKVKEAVKRLKEEINKISERIIWDIPCNNAIGKIFGDRLTK